MKNRLVVAALLVTAQNSWAQDSSGQSSLAPTATAAPQISAARIPFVMPWNDASRNATDVSFLNPAPLESRHRVRVQDGHFRDLSGRRVRFVGTNITAGGAFPNREDAPQIAARLHKFGFNCVRLHHMDAAWAKPNIFYFDGGTYNRSTASIDPQSLDRLDFFVAQLKKNGIYVDLNLHVSRAWSKEDGFEDATAAEPLGKVIAYFYPRAIELQKQYATQFLSHVNPYTGLRWADDPVVAVVEINNEDSLLGSADSIPLLPASYRKVLGDNWNAWLKAQYGGTAELLARWNAGVQPLGDNLLDNARFENGAQGWTAEVHEGTGGELVAEDGDGADGAPAGRVLKFRVLKTDGTDWHLQLHRTGLDLKDGQTYTFSFAAKASAPRRVNVGARQDIDPWSHVGLSTSIALDTDWKRYSLSFQAAAPLANHTRLSFVLGAAEGEMWLADVALRTGGGAVELGVGQALESNSIELAAPGASVVGRDFVKYLMSVENSFVETMCATVRGAGCTAPITCSQASYGGLGGVWREAHTDWIDMHSYWQHPNFPNAAWDANNYRMDNTAMVRARGMGAFSGGTFSGLAMHRVQGKPFTVSEYDHPAPNEYAAEMIPLIFAYAAWQDWDGVFLFAYSGDDENYHRERIEGFFDHAQNPAKLAFLPGAAQLFLRGGLAPAGPAQVLSIPPNAVAGIVAAHTDYNFWNAALKAQKIEVSPRSMFEKSTALRFDDTLSEPKLETSIDTAPTVAAPALSGLLWQNEDAATARFLIAAPGVKGAIGFIGSQSTLVGDVSFEVAPSARNFASILLTSMDGRATHTSSKLLLTVVDKAENPGLEWNEKRDFAAHAWDTERGPVEIEAVSATVAMPTRATAATVWALDATGVRVASVPSKIERGVLKFAIGPPQKTLWYEIEAKQSAAKIWRGKGARR